MPRIVLRLPEVGDGDMICDRGGAETSTGLVDLVHGEGDGIGQSGRPLSSHVPSHGRDTDVLYQGTNR